MWETQLDELAKRFGLTTGAVGTLRRLLLLLQGDEHAPTAVRDLDRTVDVHVADSLTGLDVPAVRAAGSLADLGSGAGFPGLVLAAARPRASVALVESARRKVAWLERAVAAMGLTNVDVVATRVEEWSGSPFDVVTARAVAPLPVLVEYAGPLLEVGGHLVAWKGAPESAEEEDGQAAAEGLGFSAPDVISVDPFPGVRDRRLYVFEKVAETPPGYPRRPGMAAKRPLRASDRPHR